MFFAQFCVYITGGTNSNVGRRRSKRGRIDKKKMSCLLGKVINHCDAFFFQYNIAVFRYFRSGGGFFFHIFCYTSRSFSFFHKTQ
jgi:hypothetical protein